MQWHNLTYKNFAKTRNKLIHFFKEHGEKRITKEGIQWIQQATSSDLEADGTFVLCVVDEKILVGNLIVVNYGMEESFMAVHKKYRNKSIGQEMVEYAMTHLGKIYGRIAIDNIPSLKVCLENGMVAFELIEGPTGKPTFWVGGGNWSKQDVSKFSKSTLS